MSQGENRPILVLGGTGHYGRHIVRSLLKRGKLVRVLSRNAANAREVLGDGIEINEGDITSRESVTESLNGASAVFKPITGAPMDELFARYMYFLRAKEGNKSSTTEALRKFYERNKYQYLKQTHTIDGLKSLALFWESVIDQDNERFSDNVLKKLFVLNYAPNGMWQHITSVYFLQNRTNNDSLDDEAFGKFLDRITAFIFTYAITNPGVNALRTPVYDEMISIVNDKEVTFSKYKFNKDQARTSFENYVFTNQRNATRSMITWYVYTYPNQQILGLNEIFHLEHIYSKKRQERLYPLQTS